MNTPEHQLVETAERLIESADDRRRRLNRERQARWRAHQRQKGKRARAGSAPVRLPRVSHSPSESQMCVLSVAHEDLRAPHRSSSGGIRLAKPSTLQPT
jgi:hypothetical protein